MPARSPSQTRGSDRSRLDLSRSVPPCEADVASQTFSLPIDRRSEPSKVIGHDGQVPDHAEFPSVTDTLGPTDRTTLRRKKERGSFDRDMVYAILDEGLVCHVGFSVEASTFVIPMVFARIGDDLYLHGATGNRMLRALADGVEVCVTVTLLDALVLARSAFHHSMNYRSVMVFGTATLVNDDDEKYKATMALLDHIAPGRSVDTRPPSPDELRATLMVRVPIAEASAKVRTGGPIEEPGDMDAPTWAGLIPLSIVSGPPVADGALAPEVEMPSYVRSYPARGAPQGGTKEPGR